MKKLILTTLLLTTMNIYGMDPVEPTLSSPGGDRAKVLLEAKIARLKVQREAKKRGQQALASLKSEKKALTKAKANVESELTMAKIAALKAEVTQKIQLEAREYAETALLQKDKEISLTMNEHEYEEQVYGTCETVFFRYKAKCSEKINSIELGSILSTIEKDTTTADEFVKTQETAISKIKNEYATNIVHSYENELKAYLGQMLSEKQEEEQSLTQILGLLQIDGSDAESEGEGEGEGTTATGIEDALGNN